MSSQPHNTIRTFALFVVAITSAFLMYMIYTTIEYLAAPDWCARAINAEKLTAGRAATTIDTCKELLLKQVGSVATNSHIFAGTIALCLLVLMVIVIAGGKLSFKGSKDGVDMNMGRDPAAAAADQMVDAAKDEAAAIKGGS